MTLSMSQYNSYPVRFLVLSLIISQREIGFTESRLQKTLHDVEVLVNDSVSFSCSSDLSKEIHWYHNEEYVYAGGTLFHPYNKILRIIKDPNTRTSILVINSTRPEDAGTYKCQDNAGIGEESSAHLIILDSNPMCSSNMKHDGFVGPNTCNLAQDNMTFYCSASYYGYNRPQLMWSLSNDSQVFKESDCNYEVFGINCSMTIKAVLKFDGSEFMCQTTRAFGKQYNCSTEIVKVHYFSFEDNYNAPKNITTDQEVNCSFRTNEFKRLYWKRFHDGYSEIISENQNPVIEEPGLYKCEVDYYIRNINCTALVSAFYVHDAETTKTASTSHDTAVLISVLVVILLLLIIVYVGFVLKIRKMRQERKVQDYLIQLLDGKNIELEQQNRDDYRRVKIRTKAAIKDKKQITGVAIAKDELYLCSQSVSEIEVYGLNSLALRRTLKVEKLVDPYDMKYCDKIDCLCIMDKDGLGRILCITPDGKKTKEWLTGESGRGAITVTYDSNVLFIPWDGDCMKEFDPTSSQLVKEIKLLESAGFFHPRCAIKLSNDRYLISHGIDDDPIKRVCIVDADAKVYTSFGDKMSSDIRQLNYPIALELDSHGNVVVLDGGNSSVLLLDSDLKFKKQLVSRGENEMQFPLKLVLDESRGRMFVVNFDPTFYHLCVTVFEYINSQ